MLLSVIVPIYNVKEYLCRCLDSVLIQNFSDYELILVDDGSTDGSATICDNYAQKDDRIVVVHKKNGGLSSARNEGIDIARGKYICFIDSDDSIEQGMFSDLVNCLEVGEASIVCAGYYDVYDDIKVDGNNSFTDETVSSTEAIKRLLCEKGVVVSACGKMYLATLFDNIRFPEGRICEDIYIMSELMHEAKFVHLCSGVYYNYQHRENSITTKAFNKKSFDNVVATKNSAEFIINYDKSNEFYARAALYDSISAVGRQYFASSKEIQNTCSEEFYEQIVNNVNDIFNWYQVAIIDESNESFAYCTQHYLNMYAILLSAWNNRNSDGFNLLRKLYRHELHRLKEIAGASLYKTPFLYYEAFPTFTFGYRAIRKMVRMVINLFQLENCK